ncbi:MAG: HAD family hydrolase [Gemmataceae bacterium]|nr:HAD family hydrolase [Gemmataceae bacterium]
MAKQLQAVFFDAVGTLFHAKPAVSEIYWSVARRFGSSLTSAQIESRFAYAFAEEETRDRDSEFRTDEAREHRRWRDIVRYALPDVTDPDACFAELYAHFGRPTAWRCHPNAASMFVQLSAAGYRVGLASNYDERLHAVVRALLPSPPGRGIGDVGEPTAPNIVVSAAVGWKKPAPQFFQAVCRAVELAPQGIVFVGDDVDNDAQGARRAGMRAVLFDPEGKNEHLWDGPRIARLTALVGLLEAGLA